MDDGPAVSGVQALPDRSDKFRYAERSACLVEALARHPGPEVFQGPYIAALIHAAGTLRCPLLAAIYQALISLLAPGLVITAAVPPTATILSEGSSRRPKPKTNA
jgi:hypothetical protein